MIEKAKAAASPEELTAMAKAEDISLTETETAEYFNFLHGGMQKLSDEELNAVAERTYDPAAGTADRDKPRSDSKGKKLPLRTVPNDIPNDIQ